MFFPCLSHLKTQKCRKMLPLRSPLHVVISPFFFFVTSWQLFKESQLHIRQTVAESGCKKMQIMMERKTFPNWWPLPPSVVPPLPCPSHLSRGLDPLRSILRNLLHQTPTSFILSYPQCWPHSLRFSLFFFAESNIADKMYNSTLCLTMNKRNHWNVVKGTVKMTLLVGLQYLNYHA